MSLSETSPVANTDGVATPSSGGLLDSGACCLHCGKAIPHPRPGQKACSSEHRWALWKAQRLAAARDRDRKIREYVMSAEESLEEIRALLRDGP